MNVHKTCQLKYIPDKIIKMNADIIPVHKKKEKSDKTD